MQITIEPLLGTLTQFIGLKINTIGLKQANKVMHMAAMAYNLNKYLKFISKTVKSDAKLLDHFLNTIKAKFSLEIRILART